MLHDVECYHQQYAARYVDVTLENGLPTPMLVMSKHAVSNWTRVGDDLAASFPEYSAAYDVHRAEGEGCTYASLPMYVSDSEHYQIDVRFVHNPTARTPAGVKARPSAQSSSSTSVGDAASAATMRSHAARCESAQPTAAFVRCGENEFDLAQIVGTVLLSAHRPSFTACGCSTPSISSTSQSSVRPSTALIRSSSSPHGSASSDASRSDRLRSGAREGGRGGGLRAMGCAPG